MMPWKETVKNRRRSYLKDFIEGPDGQYVYRGNEYYFEGGSAKRKKAVVKVTAGVAASLILAAGQECFPPVEMSRSFVMVPWVFQMIAAFTMVWALVKLIRGGDPLREYVYLKSVPKLPLRTGACAVFAFISAGTETVYMVINGMGSSPVYTAARPVLALINGIVCVLLRLLEKSALKYRIKISSAPAEEKTSKFPAQPDKSKGEKT